MVWHVRRQLLTISPFPSIDIAKCQRIILTIIGRRPPFRKPPAHQGPLPLPGCDASPNQIVRGNNKTEKRIRRHPPGKVSVINEHWPDGASILHLQPRNLLFALVNYFLANRVLPLDFNAIHALPRLDDKINLASLESFGLVLPVIRNLKSPKGIKMTFVIFMPLLDIVSHRIQRPLARTSHAAAAPISQSARKAAISRGLSSQVCRVEPL